MKRLTVAQKRVAVAQDVIAQVKNKKYTASPGTYLQLVLRDANRDEIKDLQDACDLPAIACDVCAKGAMILSYARLFDNVPATRSWRPNTFRYIDKYDEILVEVFGNDNANLIETAFECWGGGSTDEERRAARLGKRFKSDANRLVAIMKNVIDNDGTFKP